MKQLLSLLMLAYLTCLCWSADVATVEQLRAAVKVGGTVNLAAGTYDLGDAPLPIPDKTTLVGAGQGRTVIVTREASPIQIFGSDISLSDFTAKGLAASDQVTIRGHWGAYLASALLKILNGVKPT